MPVISGQIALAAAAQRASNIYGGDSLGNAVNPVQDVPLRQVFLRSETAAIFVGKDSATTSTTYGETATSGGVIVIGPFDNGGIKLSDLWVAGAGATLHVLGVVF